LTSQSLISFVSFCFNNAPLFDILHFDHPEVVSNPLNFVDVVGSDVEVIFDIGVVVGEGSEILLGDEVPDVLEHDDEDDVLLVLVHKADRLFADVVPIFDLQLLVVDDYLVVARIESLTQDLRENLPYAQVALLLRLVVLKFLLQFVNLLVDSVDFSIQLFFLLIAEIQPFLIEVLDLAVFVCLNGHFLALNFGLEFLVFLLLDVDEALKGVGTFGEFLLDFLVEADVFADALDALAQDFVAHVQVFGLVTLLLQFVGQLVVLQDGHLRECV